MGMVFFFFVFVMLTGFYAKSKDRSFFGWTLLSCIITPLLAVLILAVIGVNGKKCPKCAEQIKVEALACKHCRYEFPAEAS